MNRFLRLILAVIITSLLFAAVIIIGALYYIEYELPDIDALNTVQLQVPLQIFSQDKKLIATFGEKRRIPIPYDQIPQPLIQAVLATEDQRYFKHKGVDLPGLGRAALRLLKTGKKLEGGSTITMQVARSFYLSRQKTMGRKIREILLAIKIEHKLKKQKILELYLNKVFLGNRAYGVAAAAAVYYGKPLNELTLDQYAMLAGLPKAPSSLNPLANPQAAKKRRDYVLSRMHDEGYIDNASYEKAIRAPLNASYHDLKTEVKASYVAELAREQLEQMYGDSIYTDGFKVYTTIISSTQHAANLAVRDNVLAYDQRHGYRGPIQNLGMPSLEAMDNWTKELNKIPIINKLEPAVVFEMTAKTITVLKRNGDLTIIPWTGLAWARKQINADYLGPRPKRANQIVKLGDVIYLNATPQGDQLAQMPRAEAGMVSLNPKNGAILAMVGGFDFQNSKFNVITRANRQPGSSFKPFVYSAAQLPPGLSLALGTATVTPLQMAQAYSIFANGGQKVVPYIIDSIRDTQDQIIYQARPLVACEENCSREVVAAPRVISQQNAFLMTSALHDVIQHGTATLAKTLGRYDIAGKTGTTQNQVDAWFAGFTPDLVAVAWVGFPQPQSLHEYGPQAALKSGVNP